MAIAGLLAGVAKGALTNTAKGIAKDKAKDFITGKKKKVKPDAIKKKGGGEEAPGDGGGALAVRPQTSMVPAPVSTGAIVPISGAEMASTKGSGDNEEDIINVIRAKVIEIDKVLKGTLAQQKAASKKDRKSDEKQRRKRQEKILEKSTPETKGSGLVKKLAAPAKGLFGGIFDFLKNILIGRLLVILLENKPNLPGGNLLMFLAGMAEKVIDMIIGTIDALGSFLAWGKEKLDSAREWLTDNKGEEAGERFDGLLGALTNLFNATIIVGSVFGALGLGPNLPGGKPTPRTPTPKVTPKSSPLGKGRPPMRPTGPRGAARAMQIKHGHAARGIYENAIENGKTPKQAKAAVDRALKKGQIVSKPQTGSLGGTDKGSKIAKGGLKKVPKRLATKVLGKAGIKTIKGIAKGFSKIPIVGPIIVAVSSLLAGEPPAQALFKALGAALGGFLGTFIPIPVVGTLIGEAVGVFVGDLLYTLILGGGPKAAGQKLINAFKTIMDVGGLALKFFMDGGKRFIENFPTVDVPDIKPASIFADLLSINPLYKAMMNIEVKLPEGPFGAIHKAVDIIPGMPDEWKTALKEGFSIRGILDGLPGLQEILGTFAQFIPGMDKYIENGALKKVPNLLLTTPMGLPFLMPHVAKSFLPGLFGEGDKKPSNQANTPPSDAFSITGASGDEENGDGSGNQPAYTGNTGGTEPLIPASVPQTGVAPPISGKGKAIYLHWTAGNYTSIGGPYHTVFTGDGTPHYKAPYTKKVNHTESRNENAVGLSLAANPETGMFPTEAQLTSMSKEAARIATGWGWSASDINIKNVMTHGEAGSNLDGIVAHTNYGRFGRDWAAGSNQPEKQRMAKGGTAAFERYDLDVVKWNGINKPATKFGAGGDEMRERIRNMMNVSNSENESPDGKMSKGGFIRKQGRYELGEEGPEFILDTDSTQPIEKMLPGLLDAINTAKGEDAVGILRSYADYEEPARDELVMAGGSTGGSSYGETQSSMPDIRVPSASGKGSSDWKDNRYKYA